MKIFVNLITTARFAFALVLPIIKSKISNITFVISIIVLFLTDSIDGVLSRKHKVQTLYGSIMDTIADKTLSIVLLLVLIPKMNILAFVLLAEVIIAIINVSAMIKGKKTKSSLIGKAKMWFLSATIVLSYMHYFNILNYNVVLISASITIPMQIATISNYIKALKSQISNSNPIYKIKNLKELKYRLFNTEYYLSTL